MPHIPNPLQQALAASAAARFRLLNTEPLLMCRRDSNIKIESYEEKSSEGEPVQLFTLIQTLCRHFFCLTYSDTV